MDLVVAVGLMDPRDLVGLVVLVLADLVAAMVLAAEEAADVLELPQVVGTSVRRVSDESSAELAIASYSPRGIPAT